ncbi:MAG: hypothetical protein PHV34_12655 [Verrucomicrobiae bacterium]|nr:hypothetical protein [Verrucomicrobiae bacterium]
MNPICIRYCFQLNKQREEVFDVKLDPETLEIITPPIQNPPDWTRLEFHQCPHCPLQPADCRECPVAIRLADIVQRFADICSYDKLRLEVTTTDRHISQQTTAQQGLRSLAGLLMAASGCPHTLFLKPMARFHLPLSTEAETIFRATGMYLLAQYFVAQSGKQGDMQMDGLTTLYNRLHQVNLSTAERLRRSPQTDSPINAVSLLDLFTMTIPWVIEDKLEEIRPLFASYLPKEALAKPRCVAR